MRKRRKWHNFLLTQHKFYSKVDTFPTSKRRIQSNFWRKLSKCCQSSVSESHSYGYLYHFNGIMSARWPDFWRTMRSIKRNYSYRIRVSLLWKLREFRMQTINAFDYNQPIEVLSKCRFILKWTHLYNPNGVRIGSTKIPDLLVFSLLALQFTETGALYLWHCFDDNFNKESVSGTLPYVIGTTQMTLVYLSLAMRNRIIVQAIDNLQEAVTKSDSWPKTLYSITDIRAILIIL